jgi:uncharacterized membrane protein
MKQLTALLPGRKLLKVMASLSDESNIKQVYLKKFTQLVVSATAILLITIGVILLYGVLSAWSKNTTLCQTFLLIFKLLEVAVMFTLSYGLSRSSSTAHSISPRQKATSSKRIESTDRPS